MIIIIHQELYLFKKKLKNNNDTYHIPPILDRKDIIDIHLGSPVSNLATMSLPNIENTISSTFGTPPASRYSTTTEHKKLQLSSNNNNKN